MIPVSESINLQDFNVGASNLDDSNNAGPLISHHRQSHNMWERFRKILSRYQPAGTQSLPITREVTGSNPVEDQGETGSGDRSSNHHLHQTPTSVEA